MKKGLTHIIFVVDRSGSMSSIAEDMIGGFNSFIKKQKEVLGECRVTFVQFDTEYEEVLKGVPLQDVQELTSHTFIPRGSTALYDAIGKTINSLGILFSNTPEEDRPEKVLFVTITDGAENSSRKFNVDQIKSMITHQTEAYKWEFVYIGANQDSWDVGQKLGIGVNRSINYVSTGTNKKFSTAAVWSSLGDKAEKYRTCSATLASVDLDFTDKERAQQDDLVKSNKN